MVRAAADVIRAMDALLEAGGARFTRTRTSAGGIDLHGLEGGQGTPMVLLHGAGGGAANWFAVLRDLSVAHHVIAPDLPGFGLSPRADIGRPLGASLADVLLSCLEARRMPPVHVAGTSLGGLVGVQMALRAPRAVRSLILIDAAGLGRDLPLAVRLASVPGARALAASTSRTGLRLFFHTYLTSGSVPPDRRSKLIAYIQASARAGAAQTLASHIGQFVSIRGQREVVADDELGQISAPVLLLWGVRDRFLPLRHARRAQALVRDGQLIALPGVGHSPTWEAPDKVVEEILRFTRHLDGDVAAP